MIRALALGLAVAGCVMRPTSGTTTVDDCGCTEPYHYCKEGICETDPEKWKAYQRRGYKSEEDYDRQQRARRDATRQPCGELFTRNPDTGRCDMDPQKIKEDSERTEAKLNAEREQRPIEAIAGMINQSLCVKGQHTERRFVGMINARTAAKPDLNPQQARSLERTMMDTVRMSPCDPEKAPDVKGKCTKKARREYKEWVAELRNAERCGRRRFLAPVTTPRWSTEGRRCKPGCTISSGSRRSKTASRSRALKISGACSSRREVAGPAALCRMLVPGFTYAKAAALCRMLVPGFTYAKFT